MPKKQNSVIQMTIDRFIADTCLSHAAALSFYTILSIIPLLFVLVSVGSYIVGSTHNFFLYITSILKQFIPDVSNAVINDVGNLLKKRSTIGIVGFIFLLFSSDLALLEAKRSLDVIFRLEKRKNPLFIKGKSMLVILVSGVFISFLFVITPLFKILIKLDLSYISTPLYILARILSSRVFAFFMIFSLFTSAYYFLPSKKIGGKYAFLAGGITSVLWTIVRVLFSWYIKNHSKINIVYGSIAAIIIAIVWVYYTSLIFLFSAELVSSIKEKMELH
ncbi:MAG: YihY/virulence factor BrkB family protein [bacterium]